MSGTVAFDNPSVADEQEERQPIDLGAVKVKKMLSEFGIQKYDLLPYSKLVKFESINHLTRVFIFLQGCELYKRQGLEINKYSGIVSLETEDSWRFEVVS